jgi:hypothetical protein
MGAGETTEAAGIGAATGAGDGAKALPPNSSTSTVYAVPSTVTLYFKLIIQIPLSQYDVIITPINPRGFAP